MKLFAALFLLITFAQFSYAADANQEYFCSYSGHRGCDGKPIGSACVTQKETIGSCVHAPLSAGDFCLCQPKKETPAPTPTDPCDRRPLPRHCM